MSDLTQLRAQKKAEAEDHLRAMIGQEYTADQVGVPDILAVWDTATTAACPEPECDGPKGHDGVHRHFIDGTREFTTWGY